MAGPTPRERSAKEALVAAVVSFLLFRGALLVLDYVAFALVGRVGNCRPQWEVFGHEHPFWNGFFRWDAAWYGTIASNGYSYHTNQTSSVAFYPLFPYLTRALGFVVRNQKVAGLIVSNTAAILGVFHLIRLGDLLFPRSTTDRAVTFLLVFPTSLFLSAFYTEGLFLCLATGAMLQFFRGRYLAAGAFGFFAMLSRSSGLPLFVALAADLGFRLVKKRERLHWSMFGLLLIPAGLAAFMAVLYVQVGDPLAFSKVMRFWGRGQALPWVPLFNAFREFPEALDSMNFEAVQRGIDAIAGLGFLGIGAAMAWRRMPVALWSFVLLGVLLPLSTGLLDSMGRYVLVLFPAYYWLASVMENKPRAERLWLLASVFLLALYSLRFMRCGWAG